MSSNPGMADGVGLVLKLAAINLTLSGDNAVAMALVSLGLPAGARRLRVLAATALYVTAIGILSAFSTVILGLASLKPVAVLLLICIGARLMVPDLGGPRPAGNFSSSVMAIFLTDLAMSTDNVIALSAAGGGHITLTVIALLISAPIPIYASSVVAGLFGRFRLLPVTGAALLGVVAGEIAASTPAIADPMDASGVPSLRFVLPAAAVLVTLTAGWILSASSAGSGR